MEWDGGHDDARDLHTVLISTDLVSTSVYYLGDFSIRSSLCSPGSVYDREGGRGGKGKKEAVVYNTSATKS